MRAVSSYSGFAAALIASLPSGVRAEYPEHTITGIVPFAAGGIVTVLGRLVAEGLSKELGQTIIVENRPGAGGNIGINVVAKAKPDGYTILFNGIASTQNPAVFRHLPYNPMKDITPVAVFGYSPKIVAVNIAKVSATNLQGVHRSPEEKSRQIQSWRRSRRAAHDRPNGS